MDPYDFIIFIIGIFLGGIMMMLFIWITYYCGGFIFPGCDGEYPICTNDQYYNDPSQAIKQGTEEKDIIFVNNEKKLYYKRTPSVDTCTAGKNQMVEIKYPQFCEFFAGNQKIGIGKSVGFNSSTYIIKETGQIIYTTKNCVPAPGSYVDSGAPLVKWEI